MSPFDKLYAAFAVRPDYDGPLASDFHDLIARMYLKGMRGGHTSLGPDADEAGIVRCHLAVQWDQDRGLNAECRNLDGPFNWDRVLDKLDRWRASLKRRLYRNPYREPQP